MRYELGKHRPPLPLSIAEIQLTEEQKSLSGLPFISIQDSIIMMAKTPTLEKLTGM